MKNVKRNATAAEVMENGERIKMVEHEDGTSTEYRLLNGVVFAIGFDALGYRSDFWCMGKEKMVARMYGISK